MTAKERIIQCSTWITLFLGVLSLVFCALNFPLQVINLQLATIFVGAIFLGQYLHLQLPRTKIHLSISDAAIFVTMILYGAELGVLLAFSEALITSLSIRLKGGHIRVITIALNAAMITISTFITGVLTNYFFGSMKNTVENKEFYSLALMLGLMAFCNFL